MAGTRTAPAFTSSPTARAITISLVDASGDTFAARLVVAISATAAAIEAWVAAYQAFTNMSVYDIRDELIREGDRDPDNAVAAYRAGRESGVNHLFKNPTTRQTFSLRGVAPVAAAMQGNQDVPLLSSDEETDLITATLALATGYNFVSAQWTGRRERSNNPRIS